MKFEGGPPPPPPTLPIGPQWPERNAPCKRGPSGTRGPKSIHTIYCGGRPLLGHRIAPPPPVQDGRGGNALEAHGAGHLPTEGRNEKEGFRTHPIPFPTPSPHIPESWLHPPTQVPRTPPPPLYASTPFVPRDGPNPCLENLEPLKENRQNVVCDSSKHPPRNLPVWGGGCLAKGGVRGKGQSYVINMAKTWRVENRGDCGIA